MNVDDTRRLSRIRRNNRIMLVVLVAFVVAIFVTSFSHIGKEARPNSTSGMPQVKSETG